MTRAGQRRKSYIYILTASLLSSLSIISFLFLTSSTIFATDHISNVSVKIPVSCNIESTLDSPHTTTINPGQLKEDIGTTSFKVFCNDNTGYAIYAIGYSGDEYGNTNMLPTSPSNPSIVTGLATSGNTSNWSMKLTPIDGTYKPTIESDTNGSFTNYHIVPDKYTKIATLTSSTDFTIGSSFKSTYRVFVSQNQMADTYTGKVKYTIVHPNDAKPPVDPRFVAYLDRGVTVNAKMKNLANNTTSMSYSSGDTKITTIKRTNSLPTSFIPATNNTISISTSPLPVYILFDDTTGAMLYYSEAENIYMNSFSARFFQSMQSLNNIDGLADWDTSMVTDMSYMFKDADSLANIDGAINWDTSSVTIMGGMFEVCDNSHSPCINTSALVNIDGAKNWDTSKVTNMGGMFNGATSLENIDALANWDTSKVTYMSRMFHGATSLENIDALANWDTSSVTSMDRMFSACSYYCDFNDINDRCTHSSLSDIKGAANWDLSSVKNMEQMFAGASSLSNIDATINWDVSSVTDMQKMFMGASSLINIDGAKNWDTSKATSARSMFAGASSLIDINGAKSWNTSAVTDTSYMFWHANSLINIDGALNWDTSKVINMRGMLDGASSLRNIDGAKNWITSNVVDMSLMLRRAYSLTDVNGAIDWDTSAVRSINQIFYDVINIDATVLDYWNVASVTDFYSAFSCPYDKRPCWYNGTTCPTNSGNNSGNNTGNSTNQTNSTNQNNSPSFSYNGRGLDNSSDPISSPDSTSATSNSSPNNNTYGNAPNQTSPQGEISRIKSKNEGLKFLPLDLIIVSILAFIASIIFFLLKRRKDEENEVK